MAGSAWGDSWGDAWGDSWGSLAPTPTVTEETPGGHRRKWQKDKHKRPDEPVETRELTEEEFAELGFQVRPSAVPDRAPSESVPVYIAPPSPIGAGIRRRVEAVPVVSAPSVAAALFDATATDSQREAAFSFFDRLETKLERRAQQRQAETHRQHVEAIRYAQAERQRLVTQWAHEAEAQRQADETEMMNLLAFLHDMDL